MSEKTCVILGDELADYHFGQQHPFGPLRYWAFKEEFERRELHRQVNLCSPRQAKESQLELFHIRKYIDQVKQQSSEGSGFLDYGDTPARKGIYEAACTVVGSVLKCIDLIMSGECQHGFVPIAGLHHATRDSAGGFCVFNDCAIAIEYLRHTYRLKRIAYVDIDAHHGNGVFYAFEDDADLCVIDFHQNGSTLYPGTGFVDETGKDEAYGTKLNIPLPPYTHDEAAIRLWQHAEAFLARTRPEFILFQCGADSLDGDPITDLKLSSSFHAHVTQRLALLARRHCHGRLLALGGGGYNLQNIKAAWNDVIEALSD